MLGCSGRTSSYTENYDTGNERTLNLFIIMKGNLHQQGMHIVFNLFIHVHQDLNPSWLESGTHSSITTQEVLSHSL